MLNSKTTALLVGLTALTASACSPKPAEVPAVATAPSDGAATPSSAMAQMPAPAKSPTAAGPVADVGKVAAIDPAAGTVTFNHEPISALNWPAMSMTFTASDPTILKDLKVGDQVGFELKSVAEPTVVTKIIRQ